MEIINITRAFKLKTKDKTIDLQDPNPDFLIDEVMNFYSAQYAELTTASYTGPDFINDQQVYTFSTVLGNKG